MGIQTYQFENLYAWYSWPNVVLPIIGGYFVDNVFGMRIATIIFAVFILIGELLLLSCLDNTRSFFPSLMLVR